MKYLFDSNVLIGGFKGNPAAKYWINKAANKKIDAGISVITEFEVWTGANKKQHEKDTIILLQIFPVFGLNSKIVRRAAELYRFFRGESNMHKRIPDCLIAATAEDLQMGIVTCNEKDFRRMSLNRTKIINPNNTEGSK